VGKAQGSRDYKKSEKKISRGKIHRKELLTLLAVILTLALAAAVLSSCVVAMDEEEAASKERAVKTVSSFLEMCKEGRLAEAAEEYIDSEKDLIDILPVAMDEIISYTVDSDASAVGRWEDFPPARLVMAEVQISEIESVELVFLCSEDGRRIFSIWISD
jgi:hypothetical protein